MLCCVVLHCVELCSIALHCIPCIALHCIVLFCIIQLQTKKIMEKLLEWQAAAGQMNAFFPTGDELLAFWYRELQDFKNELPLLHKLAHDALKV